MEVLLNGKSEIVEQEINLEAFLQSKGMDLGLIIVEYNGDIIKQPVWNEVMLQNEDRLEVLKFVGGG